MFLYVNKLRNLKFIRHSYTVSQIYQMHHFLKSGYIKLSVGAKTIFCAVTLCDSDT